jgi:hypothetical protein
MGRLERQRRDVRCRSWVDHQSGMVHVSGRFDPVTGASLVNRLDRRVDSLFHRSTPELCPSDPLEKQGFLRGHALLDLLGVRDGTTTSEGTSPAVAPALPGIAADPPSDAGGVAAALPGIAADPPSALAGAAGVAGAAGAAGVAGAAGAAGGGSSCSCGGSGRVDLTITIDARTYLDGLHPGTRVDCGIPGVDLPVDTIRRLAFFADITAVLLDDDGVVLKHGRTRRFASREQRRALRAMYRHCAIPGCRVPVAKTEPHHTIEWTGNGGPTDIEFLVPVCKHHHDLIHQHRWQLSLSTDRRLTITHPDGHTMTTGPPREQWE